MRNKRKNAGFTLIEIIVTLTVLGIVAAFSAPSFTGFIEDANAKDCKAKITDLTKAYTNQSVENRVTTPGSTVDIDVMKKVLADKGASKSGELTYTGLCPDGGTYTIKTVAAASDSKLTTMILSCSKHGDQEVVTGNYAQIVSIAIHTPTTTTYNVGDAFSTEGGQVIVKYSDGSTKYVDLTVDMCTLPDDCMTTPGTKTITVAYGGQTAKFDISVEQTITVSSISITSTNPVKYLLGSVFDKSAISISVTYSNGAPKTINGNDSGLTYSEEPSTTNIGKKEYTLTYGGQTAKLTVDVYKLSSIEAFDYQEVYELNAVFDKNQDKAYIVPTFTDDENDENTWKGEKVYFTDSAVSAATADGTDMSKMGEKAVNVTYTLDGYNTASTTYSIYVGVICQRFNSRGVWQNDYADKTDSTALNQAIKDSAAGDTIKMVVSSYSFSVTQNINKNISLTITSLHPESPSTLVYGYTGQDKNNANMFNVTNVNVTFDSIILKNGDGGTGRAIYYSKGSGILTVTNSRITGFNANAVENKNNNNNTNYRGGAGIYLDKGNLSITDSEIDHCGGEDLYYGGAIYAPEKNNSTITIDGKTKIHNCSAQWGGVLAANISNVTIEGDTEIYENNCWGEAGGKGDIPNDTHRMGLIAVGGGNTSNLNIEGNTHIYNNNDYNNYGDKLYNTLAILHPYAGAKMTLSDNVLIEYNHINGSISGVGKNYGLISGSDTTTYIMNIKDNVKIQNNSVADGAGIFGVASIKTSSGQNTQKVTITGGTFTYNAGSQGAIYVANNSNNSNLSISGDVIITGNTRVETDSATGTKTTTLCNLRTGSGATFTVAGSGLGNTASIGVSPDDGVVEGRQFAKTTIVAENVNGLNRFFWDKQTDTKYTGTANTGTGVIWKKVSDN